MAKTSSHRQGIDLARFIAAFGIVAAHAFSVENDWDGHISLGLFTILTAFLAMQSMMRSGRYSVLDRVRRLLLPWLVWSAFYKVVFWKVSDTSAGLFSLTDPWSLLVGASPHLWFLPFVALAMFMVEPIGRLINSPQRLALGLVLLVLISIPLYFAHESGYFPTPLPQWQFAFPVYALGLMLALAHKMGKVWWPQVAAAAMTVAAYVISGGLEWSVTILGASLAFEMFWRLPVQSPVLPKLGQAAFGIYLLHPFFMLVCYKLFGADVNLMFAAVITFLASWLATVLLRRIPLFLKLT